MHRRHNHSRIRYLVGPHKVKTQVNPRPSLASFLLVSKPSSSHPQGLVQEVASLATLVSKPSSSRPQGLVQEVASLVILVVSNRTSNRPQGLVQEVASLGILVASNRTSSSHRLALVREEAFLEILEVSSSSNNSNNKRRSWVVAYGEVQLFQTLASQRLLKPLLCELNASNHHRLLNCY